MRRPSPQVPSHRRAFTLMELLVVVSIIAVLAAMLLPVISTVRSSARAVRCMFHLRQLPLAVQAYAEVTHGQLVPSKIGWGGLQKQWETLLMDQVPDVLGSADRIEDTVIGSGQTRRSIVRGCPDFSTTFNPAATALLWTSGYGFNARPKLPYSYWEYNWSWPGSGTEMKLVQIRDISSRIAFGDADEWWLNGTGAGGNWGSVTQPRAWQEPPNRTNGLIKPGHESYARHHGQGNYAFFDGHAERLSSARALDQILDPANTQGLNGR